MTLDPFTFEVLRHRLSMLNAEGALALQRVSGSPLATEAFDMNTSIMSASGEVAFVGPYLLTGPMGQGMIVRAILADEAQRQDLAPGDMFICNDPYVGSAHQNCVTLVAPLFGEGRPIAWAGATLHVVDVGGPTPGQVGIGARSILDEAPTMPPTRIVRDGGVIVDVEAEYLDHSRTPELNALDLRAKIAALNAIDAGVASVVRERGVDAVTTVIEETLARATAHFRRRIADLPEGFARHTAYVDRQTEGEDAEHYAIDLRLTKVGDRLRLDFSDSSGQAPAIVNCTRSGLLSGVLIGLLTTLVWDAPWCPGAIERSIDVVTTPGSVVDATWPAGCSMATMAAGFAATTATAVAVGDLLARDDRLRDRAMAAWAGAVGSVDVFGEDATGRRYGTVLLDTMASGTGASEAADGIDCGGFLRSMACVVANVEHTESQFPLLYLYRRQEPDTGGPGRRRGGVGVGYAVMPHGVDRIATVSPHFSGSIEPESAGLAGGYPGAMNAAALVAGSGVLAARSRGRSLAAPEEFAAEPVALPGVARVSLAADDVLTVVTTGGGGFGDPIEREPASVAMDVSAGLVSEAEASSSFGVILASSGVVDHPGTASRRAAMRRSRLGQEPVVAAAAADETVDGWAETTGSGQSWVRCRRCGHREIATAGLDPLAAMPRTVRALRVTDTSSRGGVPARGFGLREVHCPTCARSLAVDRVKLHEDHDA